METEAGHGHQTDCSRNDIPHFFQLMLKALVVPDDFPAGLVKELAFAGQGKLFAGAFEKRDTEALLDGTELLADRRLGDAIQGSRATKGAGLDEIPEHPKRLHLHKESIIIRSYPQCNPSPPNHDA